MGNICLVLGGIKTGKTGYAERMALKRESSGGKILYLATAQALDDEMKTRIKRHQNDRPKSWDTLEEPLDITGVIYSQGDDYDFILMDCLTLWLTNKLVKAGEVYNREEVMDSIINDCDIFLNEINNKKCDIVIVSNQVEVGLVSTYPLGRIFQDLAGLLHQKIAKNANDVIVMQAGIPTVLKGKAL